MANHKPQVMSGRQLYNLAADQDLDSITFFVVEGEKVPLENLEDSFFVAVWPELCTTTQHLVDATIHGPYESENEAMSIHEGAEGY